MALQKIWKGACEIYVSAFTKMGCIKINKVEKTYLEIIRNENLIKAIKTFLNDDAVQASVLKVVKCAMEMKNDFTTINKDFSKETEEIMRSLIGEESEVVTATSEFIEKCSK